MEFYTVKFCSLIIGSNNLWSYINYMSYNIISYLCRIFAEDLHVTSRVTRTSLIETKKYLKLLLLTCYSHNTCIVIWLNDCKTKYIIVYFIHIFSQPSLKTFLNIFNALLGYNKITLFNLWIYRRLLNNINSYNSDMTWLLFTNNGLYNTI